MGQYIIPSLKYFLRNLIAIVLISFGYYYYYYLLSIAGLISLKRDLASPKFEFRELFLFDCYRPVIQAGWST